ncbi:pseudouridine synthase [Sphingomonas psychrotolerans]|uniref:Pseudouridine synthase n=1 Tax=Sphingomonas psychrotolerans TaxID=1327635 RepID=A0A2K8MC28_9SPHN|nr:pseudouridine synthase [Sphingomonas psychrotolerans]ATY31438.1 pseudouridine synthase [Sphingomonas psychrotolerans]
MSPSKPPETQRIAKLLARAGIASRREIERMIAEGRIALDGVVLDTPATLLTSLDGVTVDGDSVAAPAPARLFRYHKPAGLLTTEHDPAGRPIIYDRLPEGLPRVMPVGRLDLSTEGLLLLTTDGELKRALELPATGVERSYRARAYGQISQPQLEELMLGVEIEGVRYGPINANIERRTGANVWIEMTLTEGKNREVRRVLEYLGLEVNRLIRTRYGPFWLGDLPPGDVDEVRQNDLITFRTVLTNPGGGKAASNLQFAVRARVAEPAPKPQPVIEPDRRLRRAPAKAAPAPAEPNGPRFTPRATPPAREERRPTGGAGRDAGSKTFGRSDRESRFKPGTKPAGRDERPTRADTPSREERRPTGTAGRDAGGKAFGRSERPVRSEARPTGSDSRFKPGARAPARVERPVRDDARPPAKEARFTPRGTPPAHAGRPPREEARQVDKPARAARAKAHRDQQDPRAGEIVDRPRAGRPSKGPAGGRGKPARPARPPRTRK